ncbi:bifunctional UDP-N-acetylglucosamine diphosphorylase/glucosamine-1-phosphate N-acetyltransferase GlmU [Pseudactinotalea suaedae]|uniref:bifunctional UDP-N-acetylglucosamine diphosphorylase/glucosamine-1-phosphate N-acetyltransferase GlmU n=1 Tax=Pseudactinotalea suaedae TaxID=1524924 RepID=UPI0012E3106C|nr:bifunctional UDP-N-acetylglucosamine diphosphorylase/glucosamine-1-phosphate N-acetyltransferase GlmU [Pseudactinotalea suaedae]
MTSPAAVIVLAAGAGTRMRSTTPKVLHRIGGRTLVGHVLATARGLAPDHLVTVVRHERDAVVAHIAEVDPGVVIADQDDVPGTGRAVQCALDALDAATDRPVEGAVVVLAGDVPLLDTGTLVALLEAHEADGNAVTALSTEVDEPSGYGRIVRDADGGVAAIVEEKDATAEQRAIREINASIYVFDAAALREGLGSVGRDNAQGEVYLTDVLALARESGKRVAAIIAEDSILVEGVNDRSQLALLGAELNRRTVHQWMLDGVTVIDPATTWVDVDVELAPDVTLLPGTQLHGATVVAGGAVIGPDTTLTDVEVGEGATVTRTHGTLAVIGPNATVGPFSFLRPGTVLGERGKIGAYVETKNAEIGAGSKVPHLSYIGDATIGEHTNIGAATVTLNYDGSQKHRTTIGSHVKIGGDTMLVAPVQVGDGAYTGAGAVLRRDVPPGALAVTSGTQRNIDGWVTSRFPDSPAAQAAAAAEPPTEQHGVDE